MMEESDNKKNSNNEHSPPSSNSPDLNPKSKVVSHECRICGAPALHSNYGAITCYPCKMFFKRNVGLEQKQFTCDLNGHCEINITNRHVCTACRLAKCFACGMQVDLIRCPISKKTIHNRTLLFEPATASILTRPNQSQLFPTTNLLQSDNSLLTIDQWTILSNLISSYDENKLLLIAQQIMNQYDGSSAIETIPEEFYMKIYETSGAYICSNEDFCTLSSDDRSAFLRNIAENVTCLGTGLSWNRSQIYNCKPFIDHYKNFYGENSVTRIERILKFLDPDIVIAKLTLSLFAFSNNSSIFSLNMTIRPLNTQAIFYIQNIYTEVIWKYLIYKFGYYQSIQRFINIIQCLLFATNAVFDAQNIEKHVNDIESLVEQMELTLVLDDIEHIDDNDN